MCNRLRPAMPPLRSVGQLAFATRPYDQNAPDTQGASLDFADHRHDSTENRGLIARNGIERWIVRHEPHLIPSALERLDGGFPVDHRRDNVAVVGGVLLTYHHPVAVTDRCVNH